MTKIGSSAYRPASVSRRAAAATLDAAVLVTVTMLVVHRRLTSASVIRRLAVPVAIQATYFTITTAIAGGSPGQRLAGLRVVDIATGRRPSWPQAVSRWVVWAGPGIVARIVRAAFSHPSANAKARSAGVGEEQDRLAEKHSDDPDELDDRLASLHSGPMAPFWAPSAVTVVLLVVYKLTVGRGAHDRRSGTHVVAAR